MAAPAFDFAAVRAELAAEIASIEREVAAGSAALGTLALDHKLGSASATDLEAARAAQAGRVVRLEELRAAVRDVDSREVAYQAAEEAAARKRDEKELAGIAKARREAAKKAVGLIEQLAPIVAEAVELEQREIALAKKLDVTCKPRTQQNLHTLFMGRMAPLGMPYVRQGEIDEAAARLLAG